MTEKPNGGPAFPRDGRTPFMPQDGMTLRDWFAGQAPDVPSWWMCGDTPTPPPGRVEGDGAEKWDQAEIAWRISRIVLWRLAYADAMIAARDV